MTIRRRPSNLRKDLRLSLIDGATQNVMVGAGETYLPAFVLAIGLGQVTAGLVATLPLLAGALLQLISPSAVRYLRSYRSWVVICAVIQACAFLPLMASALYGSIHPAFVFLIAGVYWGAGMASVSAWNSWFGALVPKSIRPRYFAVRTRLAQFSVMIGFLAGGAALQWGSGQGRPLMAFAALFALSFCFRLGSATVLASQTEEPMVMRMPRIVPPLDLWRRMKSGRPEGRLLVYLLSVQTAAQIAAPYFTPYMLKQLVLPYSHYALLVATSFAAKILAFPMLGKVAHRLGANRLLLIGGLGMIPGSALWLFSDWLPYLIGVQLVAGALWAAYELAAFLLILEIIDEEERTSILTTYNLTHAAVTVAGALAGAALLKYVGSDHGGYYVLFIASSVARAMTVALLVRVRREPEVVGVEGLGMAADTKDPKTGGKAMSRNRG